MARTVRLHEFGGPEVLRLEDLPVPQPGEDEVRIAVHAIGLNRVEAIFRAGYFGNPALPALIGYEAAGVIEAVGTGVSGWSPGDRVAILPGIAMGRYGTYGEQILCPAGMLVRLPDAMAFGDGAATWMAFITAYALQEIAPSWRGRTVVVTAAASSVGLAAIQIVLAGGGIPIATTRTNDKVSDLLAHGAAHVIVTGRESLADRVRDLTGGEGAAAAFDAVGGETLAALPLAMARGGTILSYGMLGGADTTIDVPTLMLGGIGIRGCSADHIAVDPGRRDPAVAHISEGLASGAYRPIIDRVFPLDDVVAAHRYLEGSTQVGKILLSVR